MPAVDVPLYDAEGNSAGTVSVPSEPFGGRIRRRLIFDAILRHEANRRQGTHKVKSRSEVAGTGKKLFRQKGTGNARQGTGQSPHRRGGGVAMGPVPHSYRQDMNKRARRLAKLSALLSKFADSEAAVIETLQFDKPSTAKLRGLLDKTQSGRSCLVLVTDEEHQNDGYLSSRNFPRVRYLPLGQSNAYDVLFHNRLLLSRKALDELVGDSAGGADA